MDAERARALLTSTWTLGGLVFALTWAGGFVAPGAFSLDVSTHAGLHLAADRGIDFGQDLVFSYGPLGFLKTYFAFEPGPARLAVLYGIALHGALSVSLVYAARRSFPLAAAVAIALVAAMLMRGDIGADAVRSDAAVIVLALIWCVIALDREPPAWSRRVVLVGGGVFAAIELLAKLNTGLIVLALVGIAAVALPGGRGRNIATLAAAFVPALAVLWFATGQGVDDIGPFLSGSWEVVAGYSSGARLEWETRDYDYFLAPVLVALLAAVAWVSTRGLARGPRLAVGAMVAVVAFTAWKAGFVSHDPFHMANFYATMLGALVAFRLPAEAVVRIATGAVIAGIAVAGFTTRFEGYPLTDPIANLGDGVATLATLADPGRLDDEIARSRASLAAAYGLDQETVDLLDGRSVHVDPAETAAIWAYDLDWAPLPAFQPYVAWTPELDRRNAERLADDTEAPELILREAENRLGRFPAFDSPEAMVEMLCRYEAVRTDGRWQVLERVRDRCGERKSLGTVEGAWDEPIPVPEAGRNELVIAAVEGVQVEGTERLAALLHRARARRVSFDAGDGYVFIPATAKDGLLLRAPAGADYPDGFALAPNASEVRFTGGPAEEPIEVEFYSVPIEPGGA